MPLIAILRTSRSVVRDPVAIGRTEQRNAPINGTSWDGAVVLGDEAEPVAVARRHRLV